MTDELQDAITILRHIVDADVHLGQSNGGQTWEYSKARDALRQAVEEARQFLKDQEVSA